MPLVSDVLEKVRSEGSIRIYGKQSLNLGELIFLAVAIVIMAKKGNVNVTNRFVLVALLLLVLAFVIW